MEEVKKRMKAQEKILLVTPVLLALMLVSFPFVFAANVSSYSIPGVPDDVVDCDRTAMTPDHQMEQIKAGIRAFQGGAR